MQATAEANPTQLAEIYEELEGSTRNLLKEQDVQEEDITIIREAGMCYVGQSFQLRVDVPSVIDTDTGAQLENAFHQRHAESYGFDNADEPTQLVNLRVIGIGKVDRPVLKQLDHAIDPVKRAIKGKRKVYFTEAKGLIDVDLYDRSLLLSGDHFTGPAIIEQMDTTIVVPPEVKVEVEQSGNLVIHIPHT